MWENAIDIFSCFDRLELTRGQADGNKCDISHILCCCAVSLVVNVIGVVNLYNVTGWLLQAKQDFFRDSLARHKKSTAGITASLMSAGNIDIDALMAKIVNKMDICREKIDTCDLNVDTEQLKSKLQVFRLVKFLQCIKYCNLTTSNYFASERDAKCDEIVCSLFCLSACPLR